MNKQFDILKICFVLLLTVFSLFMFVGCTDNVEDTDEVTFIDLSRESSASRGIESWNENLYPPESLYWTYRATKIRGNYTTGQTNGEEKAVVKNGPATGLGTVGPFSVGVWKFEVFGYKSCTENEHGKLVFTDLVYKCADRNHGATGTTPEENLIVTIDKRPDSVTTAQQIIFELAPNSDFWSAEKGVLALSDMYLTVPEGQRFTTDSSVTTVVRVTVSDVTVSGSPVKVAVSTTNVTGTAKESGTHFDLNNFAFEPDYSPVAKFDSGIRNLEFKAEYKDVFTDGEKTTEKTYEDTEGWAQIGKISTYPVAFMGGVKTTISGDINDIEVSTDTNAHKVKYDWAVAKITWTSATDNPDGTGVAYSIYTSLEDAVAAYTAHSDVVSTTKNYVELIHDLYIEEEVTPAADVPVFTNGHYIRNLTVSGSRALIIKPAETDRDYTFKSGKIVDFSSNSDNVWLCTDSGVTSSTAELTVNAESDSVFHTGKAKNVTLTAVGNAAATASAYSKGYHLGTDKDGADPVTSVSTLTVTKGRVELGGTTTVGTLTVNPTSPSDVVLNGKKDSVVKAYKYGSTDLKTTSDVVLNDVQNTDANVVFKEIRLEGNGGTTSSSKTVQYIYGINGVYIDIPQGVFSFGTTPQKRWNTKANGTGEWFGGFESDRYVAGSQSPDVLYAVCDQVKSLGGKVFYVDSTVTGATYKFFKADGTEITGTFDVSTLSEATHYIKTGDNTGSKDKFYVCDAGTILKGYRGPAKYYVTEESGAYSSYKKDGKTYSVAVDTTDADLVTAISGDTMGSGKKTTDYILNLGVAGVSSSGSTTLDLASLRYCSGTYLFYHYAGGCRSIYSEVLYMRENRYNGCDDWYFAGVKELATLIESGVFTSELAISSYDYWTSTFKDEKVWGRYSNGTGGGKGGKYTTLLADEGGPISSGVLMRAF